MTQEFEIRASFTIDDWKEEPVLNEDGIRIYRTHVGKRFRGNLDGQSVGDMIMTHVGGQPTAYCGFERITGSLNGRLGSFLFHHNATAGLAGGLSLTVVPGSGTDELGGLTGSARIEVAGRAGDVSAPHTLVFQYTLP